MVELDVKITSGDLYDFLLRHSYNSVSGLLGAVIGALGVIVGISRQYWIYLILGVVILLYLPWTLYITKIIRFFLIIQRLHNLKRQLLSI